MKYGLLSYSTINIGDEIQSIAAKQFLPEEISAYFDRDNIDDANISERTKLIIHGWFTHKPENWPPKNTKLVPLLISFHISNAWGCVSEKLLTQEALEFYRKYGPVGCRDLYTTSLLKEKGIDAYFSGCLTLTLKNNFKKRNDTIYIVDIDEKVKKYIPRSLKRKAEYITHILPKNKYNDSEYKFFLAQKTLDKYAQAKLVITSRLHCALPCLAFGTPVIFIHKNLEDPRFTGYLEYIHHYSIEDIITKGESIKWESFQKNPKDINNMRESIKKTCINFIGKNYYDDKGQCKKGVSVINASKNRTENLKISLQSWLRHKEISEIILIDWSSDIPLETALKDFLNDTRITIIRVDDQPYWVLSKAFNLAADFVTQDTILKLDADIVVKDDFFEKHTLENGIFYRGNAGTARDKNEQQLNGVGFFYTNDFLGIGGYNELISTWGYDDCDLYNRLKKYNIHEKYIDQDSLYHIPHGDDERLKHQKTSGNKYTEHAKNQLLARIIIWDKHKRKALYTKKVGTGAILPAKNTVLDDAVL